MNRRLHAVPDRVAEDLAAQDLALGVRCSHCGADPDTYCVNPLTNRHLHGRVSHFQRITDATAAEK